MLHRIVAGLVISFACLAVGCGGSMRVRATVQVPPELPVRVFPELAVVAGTAPDDLDVAETLVRHLASTERARVERLDEEGLERRRAEGSLGPASAVLRVDTHVLETSRAGFAARPETVCTTWGCSTVRRTVMEDVPVVVGRVVLRVHEGRTDRLLQELRLEEREDGADPLSMRIRVVDRLRRRVIGAVDPGERALEVELVDVDDDEVRAALEALRDGRPREARMALERVVARADFQRRAAEQRARVLFDLGQARRLDARAATEEQADAALAEAEETIRESIRLHPQAVFARALAQLADERAARARMRAHRAATSHNFALDRAPAVPEPPPGYRSSGPTREPLEPPPG